MNTERFIRLILQEREDLTREEVIRLIQERVQSLGGLITEEAAAYMVARDLGIRVYDGHVLDRSELGLGELRSAMRNVVVSGTVCEVVKGKEGESIVKIRDKRGDEAIIILKEKVPASLEVGRRLRIIGGRVQGFKDGIPLITLGKRGRILTPRARGGNNNWLSLSLEGVILKALGPYVKGDRCFTVVVLRTEGEYKSVKVFSSTVSRLKWLKKGVRVKGLFFTRDYNSFWTSVEHLEEDGFEDVRDLYYNGAIGVGRLRSGLKLVDVRGKVSYVGMERRSTIYNEEMKYRDIILEDHGAAVKLRAWRELVDILNHESEGKEIVVHNVNVTTSKNGLEITTTRYSTVTFL